MTAESGPRRVAIVTMGCARNEVDSDEMAAELAADGWEIVEDADAAEAVLVNTCGFIEAAKRDSIDAVMTASDSSAKVVAVGCMAERYGQELAEALPEADAVLGFDDYPRLGELLDRVVAGETVSAHTPRDRRGLQPGAPAERSATEVVVPGHIGHRLRLGSGPVASVKLASGCDRRCSFCAIPSFRGSFVSRPAEDIVAECEWLAAAGVREIQLVSENSTSYGKDLGDLRLLESLLVGVAQVPGVRRVRVAYLQPAEMRPTLVEAIADTPGVADYFDLSFQHSSAAVLRRMRRFGGSEDFLRLIGQIRDAAPEAGIRSNFIVGFPGETQADFDELADFLREAELDAIGVFGYSPEEGTEAFDFPDALPQEEVWARSERLAILADDLMLERAESRIGSTVQVLVEGSGGFGHSEHQGPEDGGTQLLGGRGPWPVGEIVTARVTGIDGVDLEARATP